MRKNPYLRSLLATTIICGAASIATPAFAQDDQPPSGPAEAAQTPDDDEQAVTVTGTRIPRNLTAVSPVTVINSADIRLQGVTRTEDLINSLPQSFAGQGGNLANGASGTATVDLRGLGSNRTLVLINGRRLVPGDPSLPTPDINVIPSSIVNRIDVLTGGASSVYGSDAVSGVVNFIWTRNWKAPPGCQYSFYQHNTGPTRGSRPRSTRAASAFRRAASPMAAPTISAWRSAPPSPTAAAMSTAYAGYRKLNAVTRAGARCLRQPGSSRPGRGPDTVHHLRRLGDLEERHGHPQQ